MWAEEEVLRDSEGLKKLDSRPPVLRRAASLTDWVLVRGVGGAGDFVVPVRRTDGLAGAGAFGSRTEALLGRISLVKLRVHVGTVPYLDRMGTSALRTDADPEPDTGV